jgi:hypothetical protein
MASSTLRQHRHIEVELTRPPTHVPTLVARITARGGIHRRADQRTIWNVIGRFSIGWGISPRTYSCMASGALIGDGHLRMVPTAGFPNRQRRTVATHTVGCGGEMRSILARGCCSVVAG